MLDPTLLLGGLLRGSMGRRGLGSRAGVALGVGAVGVAIAAFEHFVAQRQSGGGPPAGTGTATPPPMPGSRAEPPALPGQRPVAAVPPPEPPALPASPAVAPAEEAPQEMATLLVRAMVVAAWADGTLDEQERATIVQRLANAGLDEEQQSFIAGELAHPPRLETLLAKVSSPEVAEQVYTVSALAIRVDTPAEREYLRRLAGLLRLPPATVTRVHQLLGVPQ